MCACASVRISPVCLLFKGEENDMNIPETAETAGASTSSQVAPSVSQTLSGAQGAQTRTETVASATLGTREIERSRIPVPLQMPSHPQTQRYGQTPQGFPNRF